MREDVRHGGGLVRQYETAGSWSLTACGCSSSCFGAGAAISAQELFVCSLGCFLLLLSHQPLSPPRFSWELARLQRAAEENAKRGDKWEVKSEK